MKNEKPIWKPYGKTGSYFTRVFTRLILVTPYADVSYYKLNAPAFFYEYQNIKADSLEQAQNLAYNLCREKCVNIHSDFYTGE